MNNKLEIGETVYMTNYANPLEAKKGSVIRTYGFDEFDEDEREVYRVLGDDNKEYIYHYPSLENDYFYIFTRGEYINKLNSLKEQGKRK